MNTARKGSADTPLVAVLDGTCALTREDIGGKAWGINRMRWLGLPVPPAIVVTTRACHEHFAAGDGSLSAQLWNELVRHVGILEKTTGLNFWRHATAVAGVRAIGRGPQHAWNDGHDPQRGHQ